MIDTEHVKCDTCTAPEPMELDASDEASRGWPTVDIETNPYCSSAPSWRTPRFPPPMSAPAPPSSAWATT